MTINLEKGNRVNLSKEAPSLKRIRVGLGWNANKFDTGAAYDLDVSGFVCSLDASGTAKLLGDEYFVFYNNKTTPEGAVVHMGDNRDGAADGDDESLIVDLVKLNPAAQEISFIVTIHDATARKQNFGQITNSYIKLYNDETGEELAKYSLEDDFSSETAVQFGSLYKKDGAWSFKAVGAGFKRGLGDFVKAYSA